MIECPFPGGGVFGQGVMGLGSKLSVTEWDVTCTMSD
jgi:hypothetical protein